MERGAPDSLISKDNLQPRLCQVLQAHVKSTLKEKTAKKNPHLSKVPLSSVSDNPSPWQHCHSQRAQFTFNSHFLPSLSGQQLLALHQSPFIPVSFYKPKVRFPLPSHVMHWTEVLPAWLVQAMPKPSAPHPAAPPSLSLSSEAFSSRSAKKGGKKNEKKDKKRGVGAGESPNFPSVERTHPHRAPAREGAAPGHCRPQLSPARPSPPPRSRCGSTGRPPASCSRPRRRCASGWT